SAASIQVQIRPHYGEISVGASKFFICEVVGEVKIIDWFDPSGEKILPNRQDFSVSRTEDTSTLVIYKANMDNAGIYTCVAKDGEKEAQATVKVTIYQKITFQNAPSPQEFNEGDEADIVCDIISSPPPTIVWKYKGFTIQFSKDVRFRMLDNGHLQIRGIKKTDEGVYNCEARVAARGEIDYKKITVIVNVFPSVRARQAEVNATANVGASTVLACDADGFPDPVITWAHNGAVLESGDKYSLNEDGSELMIKDVKKVDEGEYTCTAKNKAGEKAQEVSLNVFVPPEITYLNNQTASEFQEHVTLTCEASGDPTPTISWSFANRIFTEGEQSMDRNIVVRSHARVSSLSLKDVQFTYAGQYLCTASNSIGQDQQALYLEVRYAPKILGVVTTYTWEGNPANVSCEVEAHPRASVLWFRDGLQLPNANTSNVKLHSSPGLSFLEVTPDFQSDFGSYNCTATNEMGTESKEFLLIQAEVPSVPDIKKVEPFSSTAMIHFKEPASVDGVPVLRYRLEWRIPGGDWTSREFRAEEDSTTFTIAGLKPETTYEVKMSAINGKGGGESSAATTFKTEPLREPRTPKLEARFHNRGNSFKVNWIKQDDGGSPIKHYLVRYRAIQGSVWKPEIRVPSSSDYVLLSGLDWNTDYEVLVVAENQQGKSLAGVLFFRTAAEPTSGPGSHPRSGKPPATPTGRYILLWALFCLFWCFVFIFLADCSSCCLQRCCSSLLPVAALRRTVGRRFCKKDESKEPIVEVRTEGGAASPAGGPTEPNETTPLTEAEFPFHPAHLDSFCYNFTNRPPSADVTLLPSAAANSVAENVSAA
uniref:Neural cell adhesion molecule 1a n=1 Tax=Tetraodon nigroviridis TaxID=99883 RepID=H3DQE6_TETNG